MNLLNKKALLSVICRATTRRRYSSLQQLGWQRFMKRTIGRD